MIRWSSGQRATKINLQSLTLTDWHSSLLDITSWWHLLSFSFTSRLLTSKLIKPFTVCLSFFFLIYFPLILVYLFVCLFVCCFFFTGFNVGSVADNRQKYQINREVCNIPGFLMLEKLLPKHIDIPEIYHLVIALLLGHPVSGEL